MADGKRWGLLAEYETAQALYHACEKVRDEGFTRWDAYTPFPVHGLGEAMGLRKSRVPWIVLVMGLSGAGLGFLLQAWVATEGYAVIVAGKPLISWQAFMPVTFELGILLGSFGAVFGMLGMNKLPQYYHPLFKIERFDRVTNDRFFIAIEATDPNFDERKTKKLLDASGATHIEKVQD